VAFPAQPSDLPRLSLGRESFAVVCPLALLGSALSSDSCSSALGFAPRCFQRSPHGRRLAVRLGRHDQLPRGLSPPSHSPCWAHKQRRPAPRIAEKPAAFALVTRSQGIDSRCSSSLCHRRTDASTVRRSGAPASIPKRSGRTARFTGASAASRIGSRTDPSHCTPRRYIGVDEATRLASPVRVRATARIVGRLSP